MAYSYSPLRYPGGKSKLVYTFGEICKKNKIDNYIEPYVGGGSIGTYLLINNLVDKVIFNDVDPLIYAFWYSLFNHTEELLALIEKTPVTMDEWYNQRHIIKNYTNYPTVTVGFAVFYLNRTNHSGIIKGGVIGGKNQNSSYSISSRYNKDVLLAKITRLASSEYRERVSIYNNDSIELMDKLRNSFTSTTLIYADPPYVDKGHTLYHHYYDIQEHIKLQQFLTDISCGWVVTYDYSSFIKNMYRNFKSVEYSLNYSLSNTSRKKGAELLIYNNLKKIKI